MGNVSARIKCDPNWDPFPDEDGDAIAGGLAGGVMDMPASPAAAKCDAVDVKIAAEMARNGATMKKAAAHFGVSVQTINYVSRKNSISWGQRRGSGQTPSRETAESAKAMARVEKLVAAHGTLPQGYIADLMETRGRYGPLDIWRAKYSTEDRPITAQMALQEWHKYRVAR